MPCWKGDFLCWGNPMNSYKLLDQILKLATEKGWEVRMRKRATSHLVIRVTRPTGTYQTVISMHKRSEMTKGQYHGILRNLNLKEELKWKR